MRLLLLLFIVLAGTSGCYATRMALYHNDLFNTRRPVDEVIADSGTPPKTRDALEQVKKILIFASAQGLNTKGAYEYYIETKEPVVTYVVQAAQPDRLEFVTWWFPVVGDVPYLGFFAKADRDKKAAELRAQGYDVHEGGAGAFSSLGWFDDPIFSSMVNRGEADLAHLFLHELTHRTLWVPGSPEFNENLAEYSASVLTVKYLEAQGRKDLVARYDDKRKDKLLFRSWLMDLKTQLEGVYESFKGQPKSVLKASKNAVFQRFLSPSRRPKFKVADYIEGEEWNNASVLGAALYAPDLERFAAAHRCLPGTTVAGFLEALGAAAKKTDDGFKALDGLCAKAG